MVGPFVWLVAEGETEAGFLGSGGYVSRASSACEGGCRFRSGYWRDPLGAELAGDETYRQYY